MSTLHKVGAIVCAGLIAAALGGCEKEGPAEQTGKKIDKAVEEATQATEPKTEGAAERAGKQIDKAAEAAGKAMEQAGKELKDATEH